MTHAFFKLQKYPKLLFVSPSLLVKVLQSCGSTAQLDFL